MPRRNILADNNLQEGATYNYEMLEALEWSYSNSRGHGIHIWASKSLNAMMQDVIPKDPEGNIIVLEGRDRFFDVLSVY